MRRARRQGSESSSSCSPLPCFWRRLLLEGSGELHREGAVVAVVDARELQDPLGLGECAGGLEDCRVAGDAEDVTALVAATTRAGRELVADRALEARHRAQAAERDTRLRARVAGAGAGDLALADQG